MPWTHFFAASVRYVLGSALVVLITCSIPASANFVFARNGPLGPPAACSFDRVYNFSFLGNANFADPGLVGWTVNLKDTAPPPPPFPEPSEVDLNILAAHRPDMVVPAGPCDVGAICETCSQCL